MDLPCVTLPPWQHSRKLVWWLATPRPAGVVLAVQDRAKGELRPPQEHRLSPLLGWDQRLLLNSLTSVAPSSPLTASFFINSLLIFTTTTSLSPSSCHFSSFHVHFFQYFIYHISFSFPQNLLHPSLCQLGGQVSFPSPPPSCSQHHCRPGSALAGTNCKCVTIKITKYISHLGTKGAV